MVIVNDTESFIAKSRQIHGDKYDYSKTTYVAAKKPITITCKKCGKEFELSQAGSHIRKRKPSGCRKCRRRKCKTCQCGFRGYGDRLFPRQGGGMCISCWGLAKEEKERRRKELLNRKCRNCGKKLNTTDKRQITCGNECGYAVRVKPRKEVSCCVCGKALIRRADSQHKSHCCSLECQRKHALIENRGEVKKKVKLPVLYRCELCGAASKQRRCLNRGCIGKAVAKAIAIVSQKRLALDYANTEAGSWNISIASRLNYSLSRVSSIKRNKSNVFSGDAWLALDHLAKRRQYYNKSSWEKKIGNKLSNMNKRRKRKYGHQRDKSNCKASDGEVGGPRLQMCFDWMGTPA